jgi:hypothetical protein
MRPEGICRVDGTLKGRFMLRIRSGPQFLKVVGCSHELFTVLRNIPGNAFSGAYVKFWDAFALTEADKKRS